MIDSGYHGTCFFGFQVSGRPSQCFLVANRKNAPILTRSRYILPQQMLHKTANGRQTAVPGNSRVPTLRFDMIQKTEHARRIGYLRGPGRTWACASDWPETSRRASARRGRHVLYVRWLRACAVDSYERSFRSGRGVIRILGRLIRCRSRLWSSCIGGAAGCQPGPEVPAWCSDRSPYR